MISPHRVHTGSARWSALLTVFALLMAGTLPSARGQESGDDPGDAPEPRGGSQSFAPGDTEILIDQQGQTVWRVSDGHDLDQYLYRSSGPLEFAIQIDGDFGPVNIDGSPAVGNLLFGKDVKLTLRVYDVDDDSSGGGVEPEVDQIVVNGVNTQEALSGADGQWSVNTFTIPSDLLVLPTENNSPVQNEFQILIDTANTGADVWAVEVDWAELRLAGSTERPLVLLHGFTSDGGRLNQFEAYLFDKHPSLDSMTARPSLGAKTTIEANATELSETIEDLLEDHQSSSLDVIAHSKGGLDMRRFIWDNAGTVANLVMIGTPNGGSELADFACGSLSLSGNNIIPAVQGLIALMWGECEEGNALFQLQTNYIRDTFNRQVRDRQSTSYWTIAGTDASFWTGGLFDGENDGTVSVESVEWLRTHNVHDPMPPTLHVPWDRYDETHSSLINEGSPAMPAALCIIRRATCAGGAGEPESLGSLNEGQLVFSGDVEIATIPANDDDTLNIDLESAATAAVMVIADDILAIDAELDDQPLQLQQLFEADVLAITEDSPGGGVLELVNNTSEPVDVAVFALVESGRRLSVMASEALAAPNTNIDITITVSEVDTGDAPLLLITDGAGTLVDDPTPSSAGTGVWETTLDPLPGGTYTATAYLGGNRERFASTIFAVGSGAAELDGGFAETPVDDDGNSLYDALVISPEVEVTTAGTYHVALTLMDDSDNVVAVAGASAALGAGSQVIPVRVEGADLFASRTPGPYEVVDVVLSREDGDAIVLEHELSTIGFTDSYDFNEFEHFPVHFDLDGFTDDLVDTTSDNEPDELQVDGSVWVDTSGTYLINARLLADDDTELVEFQTSTSFTVGDNGFQLVFPWDQIVPQGRSGPYTVADLSVYPASSADVLGYLPIAHYTAPYEVPDDVTVVVLTGVGADTWTPPAGVDVLERVFVIGGGGGGMFGNSSGPGGGGAGEVQELVDYPVVPEEPIDFTIGVGGRAGYAAFPQVPPQHGGNTVFDGVTALGGGPGAGHVNVETPDRDGGSGGGASSNPGSYGAPGEAVGTGYGNDGGGGQDGGAPYAGGGGGGAGTPGEDAHASGSGVGGEGGSGVDLSAWVGTEIGDDGWFAGGGGSAGSNGDGTGGKGGGGTGQSGSWSTASNGLADTGSGGGARRGGPTISDPGGDGADGTIIIVYAPGEPTDGTAVVLTGVGADTWTPPAGVDVLKRVFIIGAGGGGMWGGSSGPGGGGSGEVLVLVNYPVVPEEPIDFTIGAGGRAGYTGSPNVAALAGGSSVFDGVTALGGGPGAGHVGGGPSNRDGGSGGGGSSDPGGGGAPGEATGAGWGHDGGAGQDDYPPAAGGGGGGAGAQGQDAHAGGTGIGGSGGDGVDLSAWVGTGVGDDGWFAGGGGSAGSNGAGAGGQGGGGIGQSGSWSTASNGLADTGSGGGARRGGPTISDPGGDGADGTIIIIYETPELSAASNTLGFSQVSIGGRAERPTDLLPNVANPGVDLSSSRGIGVLSRNPIAAAQRPSVTRQGLVLRRMLAEG